MGGSNDEAGAVPAFVIVRKLALISGEYFPGVDPAAHTQRSTLQYIYISIWIAWGWLGCYSQQQLFFFSKKNTNKYLAPDTVVYNTAEISPAGDIAQYILYKTSPKGTENEGIACNFGNLPSTKPAVRRVPRCGVTHDPRSKQRIQEVSTWRYCCKDGV